MSLTDECFFFIDHDIAQAIFGLFSTTIFDVVADGACAFSVYIVSPILFFFMSVLVIVFFICLLLTGVTLLLVTTYELYKWIVQRLSCWQKDVVDDAPFLLFSETLDRLNNNK